jgi:hypothetical protein
MTTNYKIGWVGGSDWWNYTRNIPAGIYRAMAAQSIDGTVMTSTLHQVTSGVGTSTQTTQLIGTFRGTGSTGWSQNALIPLLTANSDEAPMAAFRLPGGQVTLRWQGGGGDHGLDGSDPGNRSAAAFRASGQPDRRPTHGVP